MEKQKVLFLSITAGQGHNSVSKAVSEYLTEKRDLDCRILDTYTYLNRVVGKSYDKGYTFLARYNHKMLKSIYDCNINNTGKGAAKNYFPFAFADLTKQKMAKYIKRYKPDVIVCPHVMTCILITQLRKYHMIDPSIKTIGIVTDYTMYTFWEETEVDYFVLGADFLVEECLRLGIPKEKLLPFGIPVNPKFELRVEKEQAREKLGLKQMPTLFLMMGGMGMTNKKSMINELMNIDPEYQVIVCCGSNQVLKRKIEKLGKENIIALGYTTNVDEYMDAADAVCTKPGGLSTSEALTKDKPLILMAPLPGVEEANVAYMCNNGLASIANDYAPIRMVMRYMLKPDRQAYCQEARRRLVKHHSTENLGNFIFDCIDQRKKILQ